MPDAAHLELQAPPPPLPDATPKPIAHWTHTLGLFALLGLSTWRSHHHAATMTKFPAPTMTGYALTIGIEWLLLGLVVAGIYQRREFFRTAFRNRARSNAESVGLGLAVYVAGYLAVIFVGGILYFTPLFKERNVDVILAMLPHTPLAFLMWFGVSLTAGLCEELIFRGYLQQQLGAWTQRPVLAVVLTALIFGSVHLYEGLGAILPLAALALVYGFVVRHFKGDLRAVIIAHTLQDFLIALLALAKPFLDKYQPHA